MPTSICSFIAARAAARAAVAYAPCRNKATSIVFELAYFCLVEGCGYPDAPDYTGNDMWNFLHRQMENDPDRYDEEWYAIAATPAIGAAVDWDWVAMRINGMIAMSDDEYEAADMDAYVKA